MNETLQQVTERSAKLVREKEQLEQEMAQKQGLQERLETRRSSVTDTEVQGMASEMIANIQNSINRDIQRIALLNSEIAEQQAKEEQLKQQIVVKEKEANENKQAVEVLKEKHSVLCFTLDAEQTVFDCRLRQKNQSHEQRLTEVKVSDSMFFVFESYS